MSNIGGKRIPKGVVLLAAYNGAKFIAPLVNSIDRSLDVAVSDDASTDDTVAVLQGLERAGLYLLPSVRSGSAGANFAYLVNNVPDVYDRYFFADQDDVWTNAKLERNLVELASLETQYGANTPCLVFSDAKVVDQNLSSLNSSFLKAEGLDYRFKDSFKLLCCQNVGQGATFAFNRALLNVLRPMPNDVIMHDWWAMLAAAAFGKISFIDEPLILYRQHEENVLGSKSEGLIEQFSRFVFHRSELKRALRRTQSNASMFLKVYFSDLPSDLIEFLTGYSTLGGKSFVQRKRFSLQHGLKKTTLARTLGFYTFI